MANFDLISEDDFFSEEKKAKPEKPLPEKTQPEEDLFSQPENEDIFSADELTENPDIMIPEEQPDVANDLREDVDENFDYSAELSDENENLDSDPDLEPTIGHEQEPEFEEVKKETYEMTDYYDEKQDRINYKPFVWGGLAIVLLVALFFLGKTFLFDTSGSEIAVTEQETGQAPAESAGPSPEEIRRTNFFGTLVANTNGKTSGLSNVSSAVQKQATLSSVLFYGEDLTFEVFAKDRDALAKTNISLKKELKNNDINIVSSQKRPGSKGGVLGVYKLRLAGAGAGTSSAASNPFATISETETWLSSLIDNEGLKKLALNTRAVGNKEGFKVSELDAVINGSRNACLNLVGNIGSSGKNIKISKLSLNASNQQSFNSKKYQLRLILQVYM